MNRREMIRKKWKKLLEIQNINILFSVCISSKFQNTISKTQPTIGEKDQNGCRWNRLIVFFISFERFLRESRWFEVMKRTELCANWTVRQQQNDMHFVEKTSHTIERSSACIAHPTFSSTLKLRNRFLTTYCGRMNRVGAKTKMLHSSA